MSKIFHLEYNGQQVQQDDLNLIGEISGLADDRVFAELFRLVSDSGSVVRQIMPYAHTQSATDGTVGPNGASGSIIVRPFRAIVGSRTDAATDAQKNWLDVRTAVSMAEGATSLTSAVHLSANSSGNPRWDLIYAAVAIDANGTTVTRKVKDPTSKVVSAHTTSVYKNTTLSLAVATGTPASSPFPPSPPSDSGTTFYVPIAFVRVPNGFNSTSTVLAKDICMCADTVRLSRATGAATAGPSDQLSKSEFFLPSWGGTGTRPTIYLPADMQGSETIYIVLDLSDANAANHSHASLDLLDSRNWKNRLCFWSAVVCPYTCKFPWDPSLSPTATLIAFGGEQQVFTGNDVNRFFVGSGQTFIKNHDAIYTGTSRVAEITDGDAGMPDGAHVTVMCNVQGDGELRLLKASTNPRSIIFLKLEFSAPFTNAS